MKDKTSSRPFLWLGLAFLILLIFAFFPVGRGLSREALYILGVFFASLLLWMTVSIDWPSLITLFAIALLPRFGFAGTVKGAFGNTTVAFLLFTFMLVYPLSKTHFVRRCTVAFITNRVARRGPWSFVAFLFAAVTFMGLFISPSVLFVAFLPFLEDICTVLQIKKGGQTGNMLMMGTAFCISLSSGMTAIGHVWPTMAMGYYSAATGQEINQFQYMAVGIPVGIVLVLLLLLSFKFLYRPDDLAALDPMQALHLRGSVPPSDRREKMILTVLGLTVVLWILPGFLRSISPGLYEILNRCTTAMPPMLGCILFFILHAEGKPILDFKEVCSKGILWGSVLMTGAATWLGACLTNEDVGISQWLTEQMTPFFSHLPILGMVLFFMVWAVLETNFSSNIVTVTVVSSVALPILLALPAGTAHVASVLTMIGFAASLCNMTPAGQSTINTVAIGSGWTDAKSMFVWGGWFALLGIIVLVVLAYPLGSWLMMGLQ